MAERDGGGSTIQELSGILAADTVARFADRTGLERAPDDRGGVWFGAMPARATYASGLFWHVLLQHPSNDAWRRRRLHEPRPRSAAAVGAWLGSVRRLAEDRRFREPNSAWCAAFEREALVLRDIATPVEVVDERGTRAPYPLRFLQTATTVLDRYPLEVQSDGSYRVVIDGTIEDHLDRDRRPPPPPPRPCCRTRRPGSPCRRVPAGSRSGGEPWNGRPAPSPGTPCADTRGRSRRPGTSCETGLLVTDDDLDVGSASGIL